MPPRKKSFQTLKMLKNSKRIQTLIKKKSPLEHRYAHTNPACVLVNNVMCNGSHLLVGIPVFMKILEHATLLSIPKKIKSLFFLHLVCVRLVQ